MRMTGINDGVVTGVDLSAERKTQGAERWNKFRKRNLNDNFAFCILNSAFGDLSPLYNRK